MLVYYQALYFKDQMSLFDELFMDSVGYSVRQSEKCSRVMQVAFDLHKIVHQFVRTTISFRGSFVLFFLYQR